MKYNTNKITLWTIITNALILIGAGHGVGFLLLIEIATVVNPHPLLFSFNNSYDQLLPVSALFSIIGQIMLLISIALEKYFEMAFKITGLLLLYIGLLYLAANCLRDSLSQFSLFFSLPFIVLSIMLMIRQFRSLNED